MVPVLKFQNESVKRHFDKLLYVKLFFECTAYHLTPYKVICLEQEVHKLNRGIESFFWVFFLFCLRKNGHKRDWNIPHLGW